MLTINKLVAGSQFRRSELVLYTCLTMINRYLVFVAFVATFSGFASAEQGEGAMKLEQSVCGLKEPFIFWLWSNTAGSPDADRLAGLRNVEDVSLQTKDNRVLRGYKLQATGSEGQVTAPKGFLLVLQGNAILADQILKEFTHISSTVFITP